MGLVLCIGLILEGYFLEYGICIFGITIPFQFKMVVWVVLVRVGCLLRVGIVVIANVV